MQIKLTNFKTLINLIKEYNLQEDQIKTLLVHSIGLYLETVPPKEELITKLEDYWETYKGGGERPLFLD